MIRKLPYWCFSNSGLNGLHAIISAYPFPAIAKVMFSWPAVCYFLLLPQ